MKIIKIKLLSGKLWLICCGIILSHLLTNQAFGESGKFNPNSFGEEPPCSTVWTRANSPHVIGNTLNVAANQVICVEPGAVVQLASNGKIDLYGEIRALGTATERISFIGQNGSPNRIEVAGKLNVSFADFSNPLNINAGGSFTALNTNFSAGGGIITFPGITITNSPRFVSLENVIFDSDGPTQSGNANIYATSLYLLLKNVTFRNGAFFNVTSSIIKMENVVSQNSRYEGFTFGQGGLQPTLLENLSATNCTLEGLNLAGGNFFVGGNVMVQNCEYPVAGPGGILSGSIVPTSGNRNNWIEVGQPGGSVVYANAGLPYVVSGFATISGIEFLPGVTVKGRSDFSFNTGGGEALKVLGLPNSPVVFEPFDTVQKWSGGQFNSLGDRMDYVFLDGMRQGVASAVVTGADYYIDNSILRNNTRAVKDLFGGSGKAYLQTNIFTNNQTAIAAENARIQAQERTNPNLFEDNTVAVESISAPDVRFNWWNSPTGPTTAANPGGTGDRINGGTYFLPFLTQRPDTTDRPPVVRMPRPPYRSLYGPSQGFLDAGKKVVIHWDATDDRRIVKQKILFSDSGNQRKEFTLIADNLPPGQRSFELTVPNVGYVPDKSVQFVRVVAVDEKGQEGFDDWQPVVPSGEIYGDLTITANVAGRTFRPGDEVAFTYQFNTPFPSGNLERFIIFDADRKIQSFGSNSIARMPNISTDTARLMILYSISLNQRKFFFSEPFSIRYDPRFPDAAPQVSLVSPTTGQQFNAGQAIPIQWTATDDEAIRYFNIQTSTDGGRTWIQIAENLQPTTTSYNWQPEIRSSIGDVRVRVIAVDRRFQNSSATRTVGFNAPANQSPSVQITFPANGATYTIGQSTFIAATANDPDGTIQRVEFYAKGSASSPEADANFIGSDTTAPYQVSWNYPLAQGYVVTARAFDNDNQLVNSTPVNVVVNPSNPAPLPIERPELTNPVDGATFPAGANITLEGLPAPTHRTIVRVEFYNGTTLVGTDTTFPYSLTLNNVPAGKYTFFVKSVADNNAESISTVTDVTVGNVANVNRTPFDFDGDGRADISVFRQGIWHLLNSTNDYSAVQFGLSSDRLTPADYDGDGKTDLAVFRDGVWYILQSSNNQALIVQWGLAEDIPQSGDFDDDGKSDIAVFRPSNGVWYVLKSSGGYLITQFGVAGDKPVAADYDGDGKTDLAVFRPSDTVWYIAKSSGGYLFRQFGISTDKAVPADYDGDGKTDIAVFRDGVWYIEQSRDGLAIYQFGLANDIPTAADYDGDGKADIAIYREGVWWMLRSTAGIGAVQFGVANDQPIPAAFIP